LTHYRRRNWPTLHLYLTDITLRDGSSRMPIVGLTMKPIHSMWTPSPTWPVYVSSCRINWST